jgi:hypothetical protein
MALEIEEYSYPRESDLEALIEEGCFNSLKDLLRQEGVFLIAHKNEYHKLLKRYMFGQDIYSKIFKQLSRKHHGITLSGLRFTSPEDIDIHKTFTNARNSDSSLMRGKYVPVVTQVGQKKENGEFEVSIQYERINSKFTAFKRREKHQLTICVIPLDNNIVEVCGNPISSPESIIIRDVATNIFKKHDIDFQPFGLHSLDIKTRVELFDDIIRVNTKREWKIEEVCGLGIKTDFDDEIELESDNTNVLSKAILEGKRLRGHKIVKDLVTDNYYFNSLSVWVSNSPSLKVKLKIEFKENPKVLLVKAEEAKEYRRTADNNDEWVSRAVPDIRGKSCIRYFWNLVHELHKKYLEESRAKAKQVKRQPKQKQK